MKKRIGRVSYLFTICRLMILALFMAQFFPLYAEAFTPEIIVPSITSKGTIVEPMRFTSYYRDNMSLMEATVAKSQLPIVDEAEIRADDLIALMEQKEQANSNQGLSSTASMAPKAAINVTPGSSVATAFDLRDKHVRATMPTANTYHYYFIDVLPSEVLKQNYRHMGFI